MPQSDRPRRGWARPIAEQFVVRPPNQQHGRWLDDGLVFYSELLGASMRVPGPRSESLKGTVWHYTDSAGVLGILQSGRLWATWVAMLNDRSEMEYGLDLVRSTYSQTVEEFDGDEDVIDFLARVYDYTFRRFSGRVFVTCASLHEDDLGQWRGYAGGAGYAIELVAGPLGPELPEPPDHWTEDGTVVSSASPFPFTGWHPVIYDEEDQVNLFRLIWRFAAALCPDAGAPTRDERPDLWGGHMTIAKAALLQAVPYVKSPGFQSEAEVRFSVDLESIRGITKFRTSRLGVTPYIELAALPKNVVWTTPGTRELLKVKSILIGPGSDQETAAYGISSLLESCGRKDVRVGLSRVPYR